MSNFFIRLNNLLHRFLIFLGLRGRQLHWGIVYDSLTKQPLDPVIIYLVDAHTGKIVQSGVTDMAGRYNFLAYPGKFKILVKKSNYTYPAIYASGDSDQIYKNLYHGEFFELPEDSEVISFNIPMDPTGKDWNQEAKSGIVNFHPFTERLFYLLKTSVFWFLFFAALLGIWFFPSKYIYAVLGVYAVIFFLYWAAPRPRWWGRVWFKESGRPAAGCEVELYYKQMPGVLASKAFVYEDGKFFLRVNPGKYVLQIKKYASDRPEVLFEKKYIRVGMEEAVNTDFAI